ncbi:mitochondrial putative sulfite oxidase [Zopfia rhizophila CBS 207.26]|uniref:Mitochondrial putative sulfite oxidase n=1 Tax=Zopfia rhizophila CBS 207.26 TaxID=1314779 RepID=A0A6A6DGP3_9PEZI|nr:mitochondrial putative sulfite oxidase [Zopfia rhizophila CBS 207.26]
MSDTKFHEEIDGWKGYMEWEREPQKKELAFQILAQHPETTHPPEFQLKPLPSTNPVFNGQRWKNMHHALGYPFSVMPSASWDVVNCEKASDMRHVLEFPYNGEPPPEKLTDHHITPNKYHFVRNHGGIPDINPATYSLQIDGLVNEPRHLTLQKLQDPGIFPQETIVATLQCSGNRRSELSIRYPGGGDELVNAPWNGGAIGTARWAGVSLKRIIKYCGGLKTGAKHLELYGADTYIKNTAPGNYIVSVPWNKVKSHEVFLCWAMNGEPLPKIHSFPLRAVVFGYIGARSCKWLYRIKALEAPSKAPVQREEYLFYNNQVGKHNGSFSYGLSIQETPVSSAIMWPRDRDVIMHEGKINVKGWAYSGGGRWPERVEVSPDGGFSWYVVPGDRLSKKHRHAWRLWSIELPLRAEAWVELRCRCWDNALNSQPASYRDIWNWSLHVQNTQHRVIVYSVNQQNESTREGLKNLELQDKPLVPITLSVKFRGPESIEPGFDDPRDPDD